MNLKFYMTPGSCSTGIHILLEELELLFEVHTVNLLAGEQREADFLKLNPKGTIPVLVTETGQALTDYLSISWWLALHYPNKQLLPDSPMQQAITLEYLSYAVNVLHGQGFTRIFTPNHYAKSQDAQQSCVEQGRQLVKQGLGWFEQVLGTGSYLCGNFGVADSALFYNLFWARHCDIDLPPKCQAHFQTMLGRPAVRQVLAEEGYHSLLRSK